MVTFHLPMYQCHILTNCRVFSNLLSEAFIRPHGFGRYHNTGCILIQTVHNSRSFGISNLSDRFPAMVEQGRSQCPVFISRSRMTYHTSAFIDDYHIFIFIQDVERNIFCLHCLLLFHLP